MNKLILFSLISTTIISCGRVANNANAPGKHFLFSNINTMMSDKKFDPYVRAATVIAYPLKEELTNFTYSANQNNWNLALAKTPYRNKISPFINIDLTNSKKAENIAYLISLAGSIRDNLFKENILINKKLKSLNNDLDKTFIYFTCNNPRRSPENRRVSLCDFNRINPESLKIAKNCRQFSNLTFPSLPNSASDYHQKGVDLCIKQKQLKDEIKYNNEIRESAKGIVTELLDHTYNNHTGVNYIFLLNTKEDIDKNNKSFIKIDSHLKSIDEFTLYIDFGLDGPFAKEQQYSLKNGRIKNLSIINDHSGISKLEFEIYTDQKFLSASLDISTTHPFALRFVGEIIIHYPNTDYKGIMKLELDYKEE